MFTFKYEEPDMSPQEKQFLQAAKEGNLEYVKESIDHVSPETLQLAFVYTPSLKISEYLLENDRVKINGYVQEIGTSAKFTALYKACEENNIYKISWLLTKKADVELPYKYNSPTTNCCIKRSPLMLSVEKENEQLFYLLLAYGANMNFADHNGETPLDKVLLNTDMYNTLITKKAVSSKKFLEAAKQNDLSYIQRATSYMSLHIKQKAFLESTNLDILTLLLNAGVDVNYKYLWQIDRGEYELSSALIDACKNNYTDKALWLIAHEADVNTPLILNPGGPSQVGSFALLEAIYNNNIRIVSALIIAKADVDTRNEDGKTPLALAKEKGHTEIADLLESAGAKE